MTIKRWSAPSAAQKFTFLFQPTINAYRGSIITTLTNHRTSNLGLLVANATFHSFSFAWSDEFNQKPGPNSWLVTKRTKVMLSLS